MLSSSLKHYPQIRFKEDEKKLWNPVLKKSYKHLPEERVRLKFIDYLILEAGFSQNKISFESPVKLPGDKTNSRTDIICYDENFAPLLLVECKATQIHLDEKTALQIARYNTEVGAPFLLVTNGLRDFWFSSDSDSVTILEEIPQPFKPQQEYSSDFIYWSDRGFAGRESQDEVKVWVKDNCNLLYRTSSNPARFLPFDDTTPELALSNYYQIVIVDDQTQLALALTGTPFGATRLNAILNKEGQNSALLSASLDLLLSEEESNTFLQSAAGIKQLDLVTEIGFNLEDSIFSYKEELAELMGS